MNTVFIGGSRRISHLPEAVIERINNIIDGNFTILIGDANGADKSVQQFLTDKQYRNVIVFYTGFTCRNNTGQWTTRTITPEKNIKGFDYYALKDAAMAKEATYGFMLWDLKSKGTLNNIINLLSQNKKVLVFLAPRGEFFYVSSIEKLIELLSQCSQEDIKEFNKKLPIQQLLGDKQLKLQFG